MDWFSHYGLACCCPCKMSFFRRIFHASVFACVFFMAISQAHANYPPEVKYSTNSSTTTSSARLKSTPSDACNAQVTVLNNANPGHTYTFISSTNNTPVAPGANNSCSIHDSQATDPLSYTTFSRIFCSGVEVHTNVCVGTPPPVCPDGSILDQGNYSSDSTQIACINSCEALKVSTGAPVLGCGFDGGIGNCSYVYPAKYVSDGNDCSGQQSPTPAATPPAPTPCPMCDCFAAGKSWGEVNGVGMCAKRGDPGTAPVDTPLSPPTIKNDTPAPTPENPNPAPVQTITPAPIYHITPAPLGSPLGTDPTVTKTTTDPDGSTAQETTGLKEFCEKNPNNALCKSGSGAAGGQQDVGKFCEENPTSLMCVKLGEAPADESVSTTERTLSFTPVSITGDGGGTCPPDMSVAVGPVAIPISYQYICSYASAFKVLILAFASLMAALIVFGYGGLNKE